MGCTSTTEMLRSTNGDDDCDDDCEFDCEFDCECFVFFGPPVLL